MYRERGGFGGSQMDMERGGGGAQMDREGSENRTRGRDYIDNNGGHRYDDGRRRVVCSPTQFDGNQRGNQEYHTDDIPLQQPSDQDDRSVAQSEDLLS